MSDPDLNLLTAMHDAATTLEGMVTKAEERLGGRSMEFMTAEETMLAMMAGRSSDVAAMLRREAERATDHEYGGHLLRAAGWVATTLLAILIAVGVTTDDLDITWLPGNVTLETKTTDNDQPHGDKTDRNLADGGVLHELLDEFENLDDYERGQHFDALNPDQQSQLINNLDLDQYRQLFDSLDPDQHRQLLDALNPDRQSQLLNNLDRDQQSQLFDTLNQDQQSQLFDTLNWNERGQLFDSLDPDQHRQLLGSLDPDQQGRLFDSLDPDQHRQLDKILNQSQRRRLTNREQKALDVPPFVSERGG